MVGFKGNPASLGSEALVLNRDPQDQLIELIRGCRIKLPNLQHLMSHWPQETHPEIDRLDYYVQQTLESYVAFCYFVSYTLISLL